MVGEQLQRDDGQHALQCINCPRHLWGKTIFNLHFFLAGLSGSMSRDVYEVTSRLCSAHLQVSVSPSSTIRMGLPSRAVTYKYDWTDLLKSDTVIKIWAWKQKVYKLVFRYTSDLLESIHALGEDVIPHDAHYDRHLDIQHQRSGW